MGKGGLTKLYELLRAVKQGYVPLDETQEIGQRVRRIPNETYFNKAKGPLHRVGDIERTYGVKFDPPNTYGMIALKEELGDPDALSRSPQIMKQTVRDLILDEGPYAEPQDLELWRHLPQDDMSYVADLSNRDQGAGGANRLYPAIWEKLSNPLTSQVEGPAYNLVDMLTGINKVRRAGHQADAIKRNPALTERLPMGWAQTKILNTTPLDMWGLASPEENLGGMMLSSGLHGLDRINRMEKTGALDPFHVMGVNQWDYEEPYFLLENLAKLHGGALGPGAGVGLGGLRRLYLMESILNQDFNKIDPDLVRGIGYKQGGLVESCRC